MREVARMGSTMREEEATGLILALGLGPGPGQHAARGREVLSDDRCSSPCQFMGIQAPGASSEKAGMSAAKLSPDAVTIW